jgi:hypothetical protein
MTSVTITRSASGFVLHEDVGNNGNDYEVPLAPTEQISRVWWGDRRGGVTPFTVSVIDAFDAFANGISLARRPSKKYTFRLCVSIIYVEQDGEFYTLEGLSMSDLEPELTYA